MAATPATLLLPLLLLPTIFSHGASTAARVVKRNDATSRLGAHVRSNDPTTPHSQQQQPFRSANHHHFRRILTEFLWEQQGSTIVPLSENNERIGLAVDLSGDGSRLVVATPGTAETFGWVRVLQYDAATQTWNRLGQDLTAPGADRFGDAVALAADGSTLAVGAPQFAAARVPRPPGYVRIYRYDESTGQWMQLGPNIVGETNEDRSGEAVALSSDGTTVAIGAPSNQGGSILANTPGGQVRVYTLDQASSTWVQLGGDIDGDAAFHNTANVLALSSSDGRVVAVGGQNSGRDILIVRVYEYNTGSGSWVQRGEDLEGNGISFFRQNLALSADGNVVATTDPDRSIPNSRNGRARVFGYNAGSSEWMQQGDDVLGDAGEIWGNTLDLSADGTILAVSSSGFSRFPFENANRPARVLLFRNSGGQWQQSSQDIVSTASGLKTVHLSTDGTVVAVGDVSFEETGAVRVYRETDQTPQPTSTPQPTTAAPTSVSTAAPTMAPMTGAIFCFSEDSLVQVQGREGLTKMRDLELGDSILVGNDKYEPVYSFGHKLASVRHAHFLRITAVGETGIPHQLTLTPDHLVFVAQPERVIPAARVAVGDHVQSVDSATRLTVRAVKRVTASGLYAPFTPSGTLLVNNVRVSAFTSLQGTEMVQIWGFSTGMTHHWLDRTLELPHRLWCHDLRLCKNTESYVNGMASWMDLPHRMYQWWSRQNRAVQTVLALPFVVWILLLACVDTIFVLNPLSVACWSSFAGAMFVVLCLWWIARSGVRHTRKQ